MQSLTPCCWLLGRWWPLLLVRSRRLTRRSRCRSSEHWSCWTATADNGSVGELAQELRISPSTATRLCDRLVRKQLVRRDVDPTNRREVAISLSSRGPRCGADGDSAPTGRDRLDHVQGPAGAASDDHRRVDRLSRRRWRGCFATDRAVVNRRVGKFAPSLDRAGRQAADVARTFHLTLVLSAAIGVLTGLGVAAFDASVDHVLGVVLDQNLVVLMAVPAVGLVTVAVLNAIWGDGDTATTDAYVRAYHQRGGRLLVACVVAQGDGVGDHARRRAARSASRDRRC